MVIYANTIEGHQLLKSATCKRTLPLLQQNWHAQTSIYNCGPTSATIVLNALDIKQSKLKIDGFLNAETDCIKHRTLVDPTGKAVTVDPGLSLRELALMLRLHGATTHKSTIAEATTQIIDKTSLVSRLINADQRGSFIIANFDGQQLGLSTGGHLSPIGAYNEARDYLLVLDVAAHKNPWFWVSSTDMIKAMKGGRGYLEVSGAFELAGALRLGTEAK